MSQFVERNGALFKVLASDGGGAWLISHDSPAAPFFVGDMDAYQRALPPQLPDSELSAAAQKRLELIQPLLDAGGAAFSLLDHKFTVTLKNKKGPCRIPEKSAASHFRRQI